MEIHVAPIHDLSTSRSSVVAQVDRLDGPDGWKVEMQLGFEVKSQTIHAGI